MTPEPMLPIMTAIIPTPWSSNNSVPIETEDAIEALNNSRRRHVLLMLDERKSPLSVGNLSDSIAAIESGKQDSQVGSKERKRAYISLIQCHLDTLEKAGAVLYDEQAKEVAETEATAPLAELIRHINELCNP